MLKEFENLLKNEDFAKTALFDRIKKQIGIYKDPNSSPAQKKAAWDVLNTDNASQNQVRKDAAAAKKNAAVAKLASPLKNDKFAEAKSIANTTTSNLNQKRIQQNLDIVAAQNKAKEANRIRRKMGSEREKNLPGSEYTQQELEREVARHFNPDVKPKSGQEQLADSTNQNKAMSPAIMAASKANKNRSDVKNLLDQVHDHHTNGSVGDAYSIMKAIPKEELPKDIQDYNPAYLHYGLSPNHWAGLPPEHREATHNFHNEVMNDKHPDYAHVKDIVAPPAAAPITPVVKSLAKLNSLLKTINEEVNKSNYGKFKGGSQYNATDNLKRKASRTGEVVGEGPNTAVRAYSTKPGQLSAKQSAAKLASKTKKLSGPVKVFTAEEKAAMPVPPIKPKKL